MSDSEQSVELVARVLKTKPEAGGQAVCIVGCGGATKADVAARTDTLARIYKEARDKHGVKRIKVLLRSQAAREEFFDKRLLALGREPDIFAILESETLDADEAELVLLEKWDDISLLDTAALHKNKAILVVFPPDEEPETFGRLGRLTRRPIRQQQSFLGENGKK